MSFKVVSCSKKSVTEKTCFEIAESGIAMHTFKSFRHWGGSMLAHTTNGNVLTIKRILRARIHPELDEVHSLNRGQR